MEPKSDEGMFVGYSSVSKVYRVFNNKRKKIEESINVTFDHASVVHSMSNQTELTLLNELVHINSQSDVPSSTSSGGEYQVQHQESDSEDEPTIKSSSISK